MMTFHGLLERFYWKIEFFSYSVCIIFSCMFGISWISMISTLILLTVGVFYTVIYIVLSNRVKLVEGRLLDLFLKKTSKIPALIEVMRPYVSKKESFASIVELHTRIMIEEYRSLYDILGHNARMQRDLIFLMNLSMQIPELQKHEYFLYIRDFMVDYELQIRKLLKEVNRAIREYNTYIRMRNMTIVGKILPGDMRPEVKNQDV